MKVLLVQTMNMNLGDSVLADNDAWLLKKAFGSRPVDILRYSITSRDIGQLRFVDAMVFAGGIIKASTEKFWLYIPELIQEAERQHVPVFLSAVGVEPFEPENENSVALKEALNLPCVKGISVRDDIETLKAQYMTNPDIPVYSVTDPAVWCTDTYAEALKDYVPGVQREKKRIGLGVVREKLFADYGHPEVPREFQLEFWRNTALALETRGFDWVIFTNGDRYDEYFAEEVLACIGHGEKLPAPVDAAALVQNISHFDGVIAGRMHSNIVAYSLGIPSVGFIWNRKLRFWANKIGYPERFFAVEDIDAEKMVSVLETALGQKMTVPEELKLPVLEALCTFVNEWGFPREADTLELPWEDRVVAAGLGGMELRYSKTNTAQALKASTENGFKILQMDLRLTADKVPVCVDRWSKDTYYKLNIQPKKKDHFPPLTARQFSEAKYFHRFPTLSFRDLLRELKNLPPSQQIKTLIIGFGKPGKVDLPIMLSCIRRAVWFGPLQWEKLVLRLEREADIELARKKCPKAGLMYYLIPEDKENPELWEEQCRRHVDFCVKNHIPYAGMNVEYYTEEIAGIFRASPIKICLFTCVRTDRMIHLLEQGADLVGSQYYDVNYLYRLTGK